MHALSNEDENLLGTSKADTVKEPIHSAIDDFSKLVMQDCTDLRGGVITVPEDKKEYARVCHPEFGEGTIISVSAGSKPTAIVRFDKPAKKRDGTIETDLSLDITKANLEFAILPPDLEYPPQVEVESSRKASTLGNKEVLKPGMTVVVLEKFSSGVGRFEGFKEWPDDPHGFRAVVEFLTKSGVFTKVYLRVDKLNFFLVDGSPNRPTDRCEIDKLNERIRRLDDSFRDFEWGTFLNNTQREAISLNVIGTFLATCHSVKVINGSEELCPPDPDLSLYDLGLGKKSRKDINISGSDAEQLREQIHETADDLKKSKKEQNLDFLKEIVEEPIRDLAKTGLRLKFFLEVGKGCPDLDSIISKKTSEALLSSIKRVVAEATDLADRLAEDEQDWKPTSNDVEIYPTRGEFEILSEAFLSALYMCRGVLIEAESKRTKDVIYGVSELYDDSLKCLRLGVNAYDGVAALFSKAETGEQNTGSVIDEDSDPIEGSVPPSPSELEASTSILLSGRSIEILAPVASCLRQVRKHCPTKHGIKSNKAYIYLDNKSVAFRSLVDFYIEDTKNFTQALDLLDQSLSNALDKCVQGDVMASIAPREWELLKATLEKLKRASKAVRSIYSR